MAKGSSGNRNGGFNGNDAEAVAAAATVETVVATGVKLRRLRQNVSCCRYG
jgi:hypothetical protein